MAAQSTISDGDWVEGEVKWWWKYVFPAASNLWRAVLQASSDVPDPSPWRQQIGRLLESIVMLQASSKVSDRDVAEKLSKEAIHNINLTAQSLSKTISK
jgi:hypothetical protein